MTQPKQFIQVWHHALDPGAIVPRDSGVIRATFNGSTTVTKSSMLTLLCHEFIENPGGTVPGANVARVTYSIGDITAGHWRNEAWPRSEVHLHFDNHGRLRVFVQHGRPRKDWNVYVLPSRAIFCNRSLAFMTVRPMCFRCIVHSQACRHNQSDDGVQQILDAMRQRIYSSPFETDSLRERKQGSVVRGERWLLEPVRRVSWRVAAHSMTLTSVLLRVGNVWEVIRAEGSGEYGRGLGVREKIMRKRRRVQLALLVIMDVVLGFLCCQLCLAYKEDIAHLGYALWGYSLQTQVVKDRVAWVMQQHAPMGFKLNERLDTVLGTMVILAVDSWHLVASLLASHIQVLFSSMFALARFGGGFSFLLSMSYDAVLVLTLHVKLLYVVFARMYRVQVRVLSSLFKLLRGKKQNVLRNRVDHCDYDKTQLLTGSIIFIVCLFLLQTSMAYYIMFSTLWAVIMALLALLWWLIALTHTLPLYCVADSVMNRRGALHAAPSGIKLVPIQDSEEVMAHWKVESKLTSIWSLLGSWLGFGFRLLHKQYYGMLNAGVISSFASGRIVRNPPLTFDIAAASEACPVDHE